MFDEEWHWIWMSEEGKSDARFGQLTLGAANVAPPEHIIHNLDTFASRFYVEVST